MGGLSEAEFEAVRREICASGPPSDGEDLLGMEVDVSESLHEPQPLPWGRVSVRRAGGERGLIAATATGDRADADRIGTVLWRIWARHLAYEYRQGHAVIRTSGEVRLHGVTQIDPGDFWVTVRIRVVLL